LSVEEIKITSTSYEDFYQNFKKRFSKEFEDRKNIDYSYKYWDSINSGFLEITTFGMGGPESEGHKKYAVFLDSVFVNLKKKEIVNLIIDIRGNGGGDDPNDLLLYSYLTQRNFKENVSAFDLFQKIPYPEYYMDNNIDELTKELKEEHSIFKNGKYYQNSAFNRDWTPNQNAFQGNLILLVDPFVASASSLFASLVKSDGNSIIIGEETLGGYYEHTGHIPVNYELPNSKLLLTFSIVDLEQDVKRISDEKYGDGVIPDFEVTQTYQDFIDNKDTQLNFAIEKIKTVINNGYNL
jgi:C-terminal processing protease CtpA/Prc